MAKGLAAIMSGCQATTSATWLGLQAKASVSSTAKRQSPAPQKRRGFFMRGANGSAEGRLLAAPLRAMV
jgi:hypothetical protein